MRLDESLFDVTIQQNNQLINNTLSILNEDQQAQEQMKLKREIIAWVNKYRSFYKFWKQPEFSTALSSSLGFTLYPENYAKAKMTANSIAMYLDYIGYTVWGSGAKRTELGVVDLHVDYNINRPKSKAYTYNYNFENPTLAEGLFDEIKHKRLKKQIKVIRTPVETVTWQDIKKNKQKTDQQKRKDWQTNGSNMTFDDYKKVNKGL